MSNYLETGYNYESNDDDDDDSDEIPINAVKASKNEL